MWIGGEFACRFDRLADILPMMKPASQGTRSPDPDRRGLMAIVGLLAVVLAVGTLVAVKSLVAPPSAADAAAAKMRDGARAIEAGLEAAATYQREKKFAEAAAIMDKLSQQSPTDRAVRIAYAQALIGLERHADAYQQYQAAIALSDDPKVKIGTEEAKIAGVRRDPALAQLHFEAGTCANVAGGAGMIDRAEEHYWMAQVLDPGEARYPLFLAMMHIKKGDDAAAAASLIRSVKIKPDLAEAWGTMAELELRKNQNSLAGQHIETARKLQPGVTRWALVQARVFNRQGDPQKAATIIEALPPAQRMDKATLSLMAESYGLMQSPTQAASMYETAAKAMPADPEIACAAAQWWERAGDRAKAMEYARTATMLGSEEGRDLLATMEKKGAR